MELKIRKAEINDAKYLFNLANDPETRNNSFSSELIGWNNHVAWLEQKLNDNKSFIYIISKNDINIGTVKFEINDEVVIGVTVDPNHRGLGLGALIIEKGCQEFWKTNENNVIAYIKTSNKASVQVFEKAKFKTIEHVHINNTDCYKLLASKYDEK